MPTYTNIPKPTGTPYTKLAPIGKEFFDDADTTFDSSTTYFDSINNATYTNVNKPTGTPYTNVTKPST